MTTRYRVECMPILLLDLMCWRVWLRDLRSDTDVEITYRRVEGSPDCRTLKLVQYSLIMVHLDAPTRPIS